MNKLFLLSFCMLLQASNIKSEIFDVLDEFKILNKLTENDVSFERINDCISSNISVMNFFETESNENAAIEVVLRMRTPNSILRLIQFGDDDSVSVIRISLLSNYQKSTLEIMVKNSTQYFFVNYNIINKFLDGRWHKIVIKFNKTLPEAYFDCELLAITSNTLNAFTVAANNSPMKIGYVYHEPMMVDINSIKMHINKVDELNITCLDVQNFNDLKNENIKEINILKEFFGSSDPHTFGDKLQKYLKIPNSFVTNDLKNFTIEITYRMNSDKFKSINLLEMTDEIYHSSFFYQIGNKMIMTTEYNDQMSSTTYHGYDHSIKVFDGNWHKLIYFYSRDNNEFSSIWVDCKMIDQQYGSKFNGYLSVLQNVTIMNNLSEMKLENFEIKTFKIHADLNVNLRKYCSEM